MKKTLQRGFTLIELLVVIAIIGILAAVVLTSLNDARDNANDASAKSSITSIRSQAEIFYNDHAFAYTGLCADNSISRLTAAATAQGATNLDCGSSATAYAVEVQLRSNRFFCIDAAGGAGETAASTIDTAGGDYVCNF